MKRTDVAMFVVALSLAPLPSTLCRAETSETTVAKQDVSAAAELGVAEFARGQHLLTKGKYTEALKAFDAAVQAAPLNQKYVQQAATVRKVAALRERLKAEKDLEQWVRIARALHLFYHQHALYSECVVVDRQIHDKLGNALSAALLAQTLMAQKNNVEAATLLCDLPQDERTFGSQVMAVIAFARSGQKEKAIETADAVVRPEHLCAGKAYLLARMYAAVDAKPEAAALLRQAFADSPEARLPAFKAKAARCPEFATLLADPKFASVMETKSEAHEEDHDHSHGPGGHCVDCPSQDRTQDIPAAEKAGAATATTPAKSLVIKAPACDKSSPCDSCSQRGSCQKQSGTCDKDSDEQGGCCGNNDSCESDDGCEKCDSPTAGQSPKDK